jgi:hypothetical protein
MIYNSFSVKDPAFSTKYPLFKISYIFVQISHESLCYLTIRGIHESRKISETGIRISL